MVIKTERRKRCTPPTCGARFPSTRSCAPHMSTASSFASRLLMSPSALQALYPSPFASNGA